MAFDFELCSVIDFVGSFLWFFVGGRNLSSGTSIGGCTSLGIRPDEARFIIWIRIRRIRNLHVRRRRDLETSLTFDFNHPDPPSIHLAPSERHAEQTSN
jgi:hypothetical protein